MKITIYTVETCKFSAEEKEYLKLKNIPFEEKDVEKDHAALEEMLKVGFNFAGTPVTNIVKDDGTTVVLKGFTKEEFEKELAPPEPKADAKATEAAPITPGVTVDPTAPPASPPTPDIIPGAPVPAAPIDPAPVPSTDPSVPTAPLAAAPNPLDSILQDLQSKIPPPTLDNQPISTGPVSPPTPVEPAPANPAAPVLPPVPDFPQTQ